MQRPNYLSSFKYENVPDIQQKLLEIKNGVYNLEREDTMCNEVLKGLQTKSKIVHQKISTLGLLNFNKASQSFKSQRKQEMTEVSQIESPLILLDNFDNYFGEEDTGILNKQVSKFSAKPLKTTYRGGDTARNMENNNVTSDIFHSYKS